MSTSKYNGGVDGDYDYHAGSNGASGTPTREVEQRMARSSLQKGSSEDVQAKKSTDEALMDLAQLEELQEEAERMKALGNKHMAAQVSAKATKRRAFIHFLFCSLTTLLFLLLIL